MEYFLPGEKLDLKKLAGLLDKDRTAFSRWDPATIAQLETALGAQSGELSKRIRSIQELGFSSGDTPEVIWTSEQAEHIRQLEGFYQLIRPHTDGPGRFVLEPMQILRTAISLLEVAMYTVRFRTRDLLYIGQGCVHYPRFLFAFLKRPRSAEAGSTFRSIGMQVDLLSGSPNCFAGVMLRGSGNDSIVAYRFVAIKSSISVDQNTSTAEAINFSSASFTALPFKEGPMHRVFAREAILIGEVSRENMPKTFALCTKIFKSWTLEDRHLMGMKLQSNRGVIITEIVVEAMGRAGRRGAYAGWHSIVNQDLTKR